MEDIQNYSDKITELMNEYEQIVTSSELYDSNRMKWKQMCVDRQRKIKNLLLQMKQEMDQLGSSNSSSFNTIYKQHQTKLTAVFQEYNRKLKLAPKMQSVRKSIPRLNEQQSPSSGSRTIEDYFKRGDKQIARMKDAVQSMNAEIQEGLALAQQVNLELNKQIQQLDNIEDTVKDTKSTLKRADQIISFFAKAAQCDKCILGLVLMIILAAIAFIVILIKKK